MTQDNEDYQDGIRPEEHRMPFTEHLRELRKRIIYSLIGVGIGFGIAYYFSKEIFQVLMLPLLDVLPEGEHLIYTGLPEAFFTYLKVGLWGGIILAAPVIFYQIWAFVAPGLFKHERKYFVPFVTFGTLLFITGGAFGYFVVFPFGFKFFIGFSDEYIRILPAVREYFSLAIKLLFGFGIAFQLPLIMVLLAKMGIVDAKGLARFRKYSLLLVFVAAAIMTPPDVISQVLMALPLLVLYEISIILVRIIGRKKKKKMDELLGVKEEAETET